MAITTQNDKLLAIFKQFGMDHKALADTIGTVSDLNTTNKTSLVAALNEVKSAIISAQNGAITESAVDAKVKALETKLLGGTDLDASLDTLKEIADKLKAGDSTASTVLSGLANRVRFDEAQTLNDTQLTQVYSNLKLGDPNVDFLDAYNKAKRGQA